jgi:hypothetical protein
MNFLMPQRGTPIVLDYSREGKIKYGTRPFYLLATRPLRQTFFQEKKHESSKDCLIRKLFSWEAFLLRPRGEEKRFSYI